MIEENDQLEEAKSSIVGSEELSAPIVQEKKQLIWWAELIGSTFLFAAAYLVLYIVYDYVTALAAAHFQLKPVLFYDTIRYENNAGWYPHCVKRVFLIGAIVMGIAGISLYILYLIFRKSYIFVRLFLLWGSLIAFSVLAQRMMSVPFAGNFEYRRLDALGMELAIFTSYMYYKDSTEWAIGFLGFLLIGSIGILYAKPFLQTAWSSKQIGSEFERYKFLRYQVLLPCVLGALVVTVVLYPHNIIPNSIAFVGSLFCLLIMIIHAMLMGSFKIPRQKTWERWPIVPTIAFILIIILIKTALTTGIVVPDPHIYDWLNPQQSDL